MLNIFKKPENTRKFPINTSTAEQCPTKDILIENVPKDTKILISLEARVSTQ